MDLEYEGDLNDECYKNVFGELPSPIRQVWKIECLQARSANTCVFMSCLHWKWNLSSVHPLKYKALLGH